jgi:phosphoglycolate phosphatase
MIESVIFDFDGTLADSSFAIKKLNNYFIDKYKINRTDSEDLKRISALPLRQRFKELGIPFYKLPLMSLEAIKIYSSFIDEIKIIEGIPDILKKLAEIDMDMNILSSNSVRNIRQVLQKNNLNFFSEVYSASKVLKKDKTIIKLLKKKNLPKNSVVYVGDQLEDINSCKRIKVKVVAVSWGYDPVDLLMQGEPDYLCRKPADLYKYLISGKI